jgi:Domain of unknown function (DUF1841)
VCGVSPQSKGRKRKKQATRARRQPPGPEMMVARMAQDAFGAMEDATDALDAELFVSELVGSWWALPVEVDPEVELGERLVAYAVRRQRPGAVALLRVLAQLGTDRQRTEAASGADALVAAGVEEPVWVRGLGTERLAGTWEYRDVFGDQSTVVLVVERGGARHGVVALVDHNVGIVKEAFATAEPDAALADLKTVAQHPSTGFREITAEEAAAIVVPAFVATDAATRDGLELPMSESVASSRALLAARLRLLPDPGPDAAPAHGLPDAAARSAVVEEFLSSPHARDLPEGARGCAELLVEFGDAVDPARPLRVGPGLIDQFLDETLNDGPQLSDDELEALPATVRAWAEWAGRRAGLPDAALAELRAAADDMACSIGRPGDPVPVGSDVADAYLAGLDLDDVRPEDLPDLLERRMFAVPGVGTRIGDEEFPFLDPSDPDDRGMLIEGEHPEYHDALADPGSGTVDGVNPRLHITVHEIVANQLWDDDPPEVWQAAKRLSATGMDRHDVLHAIGEVLTEHLYGALTGSGPSDPARYVEQIDMLGRTEETRVVPLRRKR